MDLDLNEERDFLYSSKTEEYWWFNGTEKNIEIVDNVNEMLGDQIFFIEKQESANSIRNVSGFFDIFSFYYKLVYNFVNSFHENIEKMKTPDMIRQYVTEADSNNVVSTYKYET